MKSLDLRSDLVAWVRMDDRYTDHPKVIGLSDAAFRLHVRAICYANGHLTNGIVPDAFLNGCDDLVGELLKAGLLETNEAGAYVLHDYLEYQPSKDEVLMERQKAKERMSRVRANVARTSSESQPKFEGSSVYPGPGPGPVPKEEKDGGKGRFAPPSIEDIQKFISEKGYHFEAEAFHAFYESNGWKVGNNHMRSWKAACVTWENREGKVSSARRSIEHAAGTNHPPMYTGARNEQTQEPTEEEREKYREEHAKWERENLPKEQWRVAR